MALIQTNYATSVAHPRVRDITARDLHWALRAGVNDFLALRGDILFAAFIYPTVAILAAAFALDVRLTPIVFPIIAAFSLMGPVFAIGFYELARRRREGVEPRWSHFLDPLRGPSRMQIMALAALLAMIAVVWLVTAKAIFEATLGTLHPATVGAFLRDLFGTTEGWRLILFGNLAGLGFAVVTLGIAVVSFPMMVDRPVHAFDAVETSLRAMGRNPAVILRWGLYVAAILLLASIPLFLGLAVAFPVLGYASWHLYTRIVDRQ
ncbi:DUF2189 domain-containing protein [soil metagenome]